MPAATAELIRQIAANDVLAAMITPAVLISACGTLALSTSNRLGRVVDRVRELSNAVERIAPPDDAIAPELLGKRHLIGKQLDHLSRRLSSLQSALTLIYAALGLLVACSLTIGLRSALHLMPERVPIALGLLGATSMFAASVLLVRETRLAVASSLLEMAYIDKLMKAKLGESLSYGSRWHPAL